jgi:DNA mismatch repair protein MutL
VSRIVVLPEAVASRIAAGEVVERPASVVKELVENALDAGARRVDVDLEDGGKRLVLVRDDGCGMDRDDALLAFEPHATSKIRSETDLFALSTFGFRGEALAAIRACARVTLVTAQAPGEGTRVRFEHGRLHGVAAVGAPRGTSVEVRDLFGSVPARRKFLRTSGTELSHVVRYLELQALVVPGVHVTLSHERPVLDAPPAPDVSARIAQLLGPDLIASALHVAGERDGIRVEAWLVRGGVGAGRFGPATTLVNGRVVADRGLAHALREAGQWLFGVDQAPAGIAVVTLDPQRVDVNVHPAKREVRFSRPWEVHDTVRDIIRGCAEAGGAFGPAVDVAGVPGRLASAPPSAPAAGGVVAETARPFGAAASGGAPSWTPSAGTGAGPRGHWSAPTPAAPVSRGRRILGQHRNTYIVAEDEQGLLLIDQHAAHERVLYERILKRLDDGQPRQGLLQPIVIDVPRHLVPVLRERLPDLARLGVEVDEFGEGSFRITAVPEAAGTADPAEMLRELAAQEIPASSPVRRVDRLAATVACKAAVKAGFVLGGERLRYIADALFETEVPTTCPHGRVALLRLSDRDLDHRFGRI